MSKPVAVVFMLLTLAAGVLLGNQYGRRDVVNSRPPKILGQTGQTGIVSADDTYKLDSLSIYNNTRTEIFGSASLLRLPDRNEAVVYIAKFPENTSDELKLVLFSKGNQPVTELTTVFVRRSRAQIIRVKIETIEPGSYLGLVPVTTGSPILVSDAIN